MTAPEVAVQRRRGIPIVWIIPVVAALVGAWIWYEALQEVGPTITIDFETAEGIEAGKTKLRFKNVEVGEVEHVDLKPDLTGVIVTAQLTPQCETLLVESTRFWVVRPRIGTEGISGLGTIISGAYIAMEPGPAGDATEHFDGLELPPVAPADAPGLKLVLEADRLGSVGIGSPVYHKDIEVGQVERHVLHTALDHIDIEVYIEEEFRSLVTANTRFWNASGIDFNLSAEGVEVSTQSLTSILSGGIAFETAPGLPPGPPVRNGSHFPLYEDYEASKDVFTETETFALLFSGSVRGLKVGAPVEFRGIHLGHVTDIWMEFDRDSLDVFIPVLIVIERDRVMRHGHEATDQQEMFSRLIERGLRARLELGNIVTGALYVDLDFHPETEAVFVGAVPDVMEIPTIPTALQELFDKAIASFDGLADLVASDEVVETLETVQDIITQLDTLLAVLNANAPEAMAELAGTLRSMRHLADTLERHPEALIQGKEIGNR